MTLVKVGYSVIDSSNNEIQSWGNTYQHFEKPSIIFLPNDVSVNCPEINAEYAGHRLVERWINYDPSIESLKESETTDFVDDKIVITHNYRNPTVNELYAYSANKRWIKETSGVTVDDYVIYTDRQSQSMITGVITLMASQPNITINFKTASGFIQANSDIIMKIATSIANHVQTCFSQEGAISANIEAQIITTYQQIDDIYSNN
jgi:hypothetical protein